MYSSVSHNNQIEPNSSMGFFSKIMAVWPSCEKRLTKRGVRALTQRECGRKPRLSGRVGANPDSPGIWAQTLTHRLEADPDAVAARSTPARDTPSAAAQNAHARRHRFRLAEARSAAAMAAVCRRKPDAKARHKHTMYCTSHTGPYDNQAART